MGQYHVPVNLDKKEFIDPHQLAAGLKQWEQIAQHPSTPVALAILLFSSNERGGGDLARDYEAGLAAVGRWAGDRIAIVGDYSEREDLPDEFEAETIYDACFGGGSYTDITPMVCEVIEKELEGKFEGTGWRDFNTSPPNTDSIATGG